MEKRVLIVEDEKSISDAIAYALRREGFVVDTAYDGEEALKKVKSFGPQLLLLDIMIPRLNGFEVCKRLESRDSLGIILLTAKSDIVDKVLGLELGADDYMTKPFDMRELAARVRALFRRLEKNASAEQDTVEWGGVKLSVAERRVFSEGRQLELTPKEFDLLSLLLVHPERVFTRDELLDRVWGMEYPGGTRTVDIHVQRLRKKLGSKWQSILQTVHGIGYKATGDHHEK